MQSNRETINWEFWDIHIGEEDIRHRLMVRDAINEIVKAEPDYLQGLAVGYQKAKSNWDEFWRNNYQLAKF